MIKAIQFLAGWTFAIFIMNKFVFALFKPLVESSNALIIICGLLITSFTVIYGVICFNKG